MYTWAGITKLYQHLRYNTYLYSVSRLVYWPVFNVSSAVSPNRYFYLFATGN
jgi:hypothetical protein